MALIITKNALKLLAMNNASCKVFTEKKILNLQYLTECARKNRDYDFDELVAHLPEVGHMYVGIKAFAEHSLKVGIIDENVMARFFGGVGHIEYVIEQAQMMDLATRFGKDFVSRFIFAHVLIPIEIVKIGATCSGTYENAGVKVGIENLLIHPFITEELSIGQRVLVHQALIIGAVVDDAVITQLLSVQAAHKDFINIAKNIKSIDYESFWDLANWTKEVIKKV